MAGFFLSIIFLVGTIETIAIFKMHTNQLLNPSSGKLPRNSISYRATT